MYEILIPKNYTKYSIPSQQCETYKKSSFKILCDDCYITQDSNDQYTKHYIRNVESTELKHYFKKNQHLYINKSTIYKKKTSHIPFEHHVLQVSKTIYKTHKQSPYSFIFETLTNKKGERFHKQYIQSVQEIDPYNPMTKETICSLVTLFN